MSAGPDHQADQVAGPLSRLLTLARPLSRSLTLALMAVWALLTAIAVISMLAGRTPWSGDLEGLLPVADRTPAGRTLVLLQVDQDALAPEPTEDDTGPNAGTILADAGFAIEEAFPDERVPLAPPKTEITRWLDAHALYLLPIDTHAALAERLTDAAMLAQVQSLAARLSSPAVFGVR